MALVQNLRTGLNERIPRLLQVAKRPRDTTCSAIFVELNASDRIAPPACISMSPNPGRRATACLEMPTRPIMSKRTGKQTGRRFSGGDDAWTTEFMTTFKGTEPAQLTFSLVHFLVSSDLDDSLATPWNVKRSHSVLQR